jgi:transposase
LEENAPEGAQSPKAMAEELAQLRKELAKQKRMNEILKKTVGFFSNDQ